MPKKISNQNFMRLCRAGQLDELKKAFSHNQVDLDMVELEKSAIREAIEGNCLEVVKFLVGKDLDVNWHNDLQKKKYTNSPLYLAIEKGYGGIACYLIESGKVNVTAIDTELNPRNGRIKSLGLNALYHAVKKRGFRNSHEIN